MISDVIKEEIKKLYKMKLAAVCVIYNQKNEILLCKRSNNDFWMPEKFSLPGGGVDLNEKIIDGVIRECKEEVNINLDKENVQFCFEKVIKDKIRVSFFKSILPNDSKIKLSDEHTEYNWVKLDEFKDYSTVPNLSEDVKKCLETKINPSN